MGAIMSGGGQPPDEGAQKAPAWWYIVSIAPEVVFLIGLFAWAYR